MKKSLTFLLLLLSLTLSAQYRLDVGLGYDYPNFKIEDNYPDHNFENIKVYGLQGHLGLHRTFSSFYSHSYGIAYLNQWAKYKTIYTSNDTITTTSDSKLSFGRFQLYYLAKLYPFKDLGIAFNAGIAYERQQFVGIEMSGEKSFESIQTFYLPEIVGTIGLSYDKRISKKVSLYTQFTVSKLIFSLGHSYFDPLSGDNYGTADYRLKLGMLYDLKLEPVSPKKRLEKLKTDPIKTTYFRNFDLKVFYSYSSRKFIEPESIPIGPICGYCTESYTINDDKVNSHGVGVGLSFSQNRLYASLDVSWENYSGDFKSNYVVSEYHPHLPWGTIQDYYKETDVLSTSFQRIRVATGVGVKILHPNSKVNIIPSIKIVQGYIVNQKIDQNYMVKSSVYNWEGNPNPSSNYAWDSISYPSRFIINKFGMDLLVGSTFTAQILNRVQVNCDLFYALGSGAIVSNRKNPFSDKLRYFCSFGIGYKIPLKDKPKN